MMDRRQFLRRASLIAAGIVAADQLDVLGMLAPRRLFAGADFNTWPLGITDTLQSTTVHGLSTSTYPLWNAGPALNGSHLSPETFAAIRHAFVRAVIS